MARPKSSNPTKQKLNLTVTAQTRADLVFLSTEYQMSISELIAAYAAKESLKVARKNGKSLPDVNQMTIDAFVDE